MKKTELIQKIAENTNLTKAQSDVVLKAFAKVITDALVEGEKVSVPGLGTFEVRERAARKGVNPATKEVIDIAATKVPGFKASSALKAAVKK